MNYPDPGARMAIQETTIRMPYLPESLVPASELWPLVTPGSPRRLRLIAEQIGRQFTYETRFPAVYSVDSPGPAVVLLPSRHHKLVRARLIAGAIGISDCGQDAPKSTWLYVHPYERGLGLVEEAWPFVADTWPGVRIVGPFTHAGARLRDRLEGRR